MEVHLLLCSPTVLEHAAQPLLFTLSPTKHVFSAEFTLASALFVCSRYISALSVNMACCTPHRRSEERSLVCVPSQGFFPLGLGTFSMSSNEGFRVKKCCIMCRMWSPLRVWLGLWAIWNCWRYPTSYFQYWPRCTFPVFIFGGTLQYIVTPLPSIDLTVAHNLKCAMKSLFWWNNYAVPQFVI